MTNTMTKKAFFQAIANNEITEDHIAYAVDQVEKINNADEARKGKLNAKSEAFNNEVCEIIAKHITTEVVTAAALAETLEISTQKASSILRRGVDLGALTVEDTKGPKGIVKGYQIV